METHIVAVKLERLTERVGPLIVAVLNPAVARKCRTQVSYAGMVL